MPNTKNVFKKLKNTPSNVFEFEAENKTIQLIKYLLISILLLCIIIIVLVIIAIFIVGVIAWELYSESSTILVQVDDKIHTVFDIAVCSIENVITPVAEKFSYSLGLDFTDSVGDIGTVVDMCVDDISSYIADSGLASELTTKTTDFDD